ncbi:BREX-1 system adenine-specific DNA-methyltransferase PglX [Microbacterium sp.]|uniref:BREX-1 system adenine-specific DNA-methyltransferase PglX n=1 Tax=Microbacterium sp. TaxID=51671 RepID=UPI0025ED9FD1|nr:BREX-1 system adenine-specific DNA-methyltransferase PglX [Microbacterium sp.]
METAPLKSFATKARTDLIKEVGARVSVVLAENSLARVESLAAVRNLEGAIARDGRDQVIDRVAYTWFNRIIALRFMDANGYTPSAIVSPEAGRTTGQPEVLAEAKAGSFDSSVVPEKTQETITALFNRTRPSQDPDGEAYGLLLEAYCRSWHKAMPFMFEREGDYTELLIPAALLAVDSVRDRAVKTLTEDVCRDVEVIGWLYQFYISERKDEVFDGFKKNKKAGAAEIPAATQLFTPHWIVRYLVENSLGRLWLLNNPSSRLAELMDYYIKPVDEETEFLKIAKPEELKVIDPAVGSGHMLTYAFDLLYAIYMEKGYDPAQIPGLILQHNLYGTEIDPRAGALAAFALTMKAAAKRKLFLKSPVQPNVCVLENVHFDPAELDYLWTLANGGGVARGDADEFWSAFEHADTFGSLIQPKEHLIPALKAALEGIEADGDLLHGMMLQKAALVLAQAEYLSRPYSVVVANPPYMGAGNMGSLLATFAKESYPPSRTDLFAMFIERCVRLAGRSGQVAMITMQSWMFLASFEKLRERILQFAPPVSMAHLGERAFDSIGGAVVSTTAFVLQVGRPLGQTGSYLRLVDGRTEAEKSRKLLAAAAGRDGSLYRSSGETFSQIPGTPIVYWLSADVRRAFALGRPLGEVAELREGLSSSDADRFVRLWWEVSAHSRVMDAPTPAAAEAGGAKWFPFNKGGDFRKWYGNHEYVINWQNGGAEILAERPKSTVRSPQFYFRSCVSWSKISTGSPAFRSYPQGFVLGSAAKSVYVGSEQEATLIMSICNSSLVQVLLEAKSPTMSFVAEDVGSLPILATQAPDEVLALVAELQANSTADWDESETSWNFARTPFLVDETQRTLPEAFDKYRQEWTSISLRQQALEESNNEAITKLYGLDHEVQTAVPLGRVTLTRNAAFRYSGKPASEHSTMFLRDAAKDLVSYAVGCMFGRYSLDEPGVILADQGSTVQEFLTKVPSQSFMPDQDNVIPIVDGDWFEDDIVARFRKFLRVAFGDEHFEENLQFVTESLGVKDIRDYFVKSFYDDHVRRYKKRPIYWLFRSPKGSFSALIYLHRYNPTTASTVLTGYLREFIGKLEANLEHQGRVSAGMGGASARDIATALKEADRIRRVLVELRDYEHDVLFPLAGQQIALDLDDGVLVNYQKLGAALKDIGLKKGGGGE